MYPELSRRQPGAQQKRAIFFAYEGGVGLGHLRRLACVAKMLQGRFACLIVTSHLEAAQWFVSKDCEFIRLPGWDSLVASRAGYWGRRPFLTLDETQALQFRKQMLASVVAAFEPDLMFVDHLPLGKNGELSDIVEHSPCRKYLVTRGIQNETENLEALLLGGSAMASVQSHYHRVLAAIDRRVFDFTEHYNLPQDVREKTVHTGYVIEPIAPETAGVTRRERGLSKSDVWVVASAGGGQHGEDMIQACRDLAARHCDVVFDIVVGPRSNLPWDSARGAVFDQGNVRLHRSSADLRQLHASADLVVSSGGYNSLLEALQGRARIVCLPSRRDVRDEPYQHAARLKPFADIEVSIDLDDLTPMVERGLAAVRTSQRADRRATLDYSGASNINRIVEQDFALAE